MKSKLFLNKSETALGDALSLLFICVFVCRQGVAMLIARLREPNIKIVMQGKFIGKEPVAKSELNEEVSLFHNDRYFTLICVLGLLIRESDYE